MSREAITFIVNFEYLDAFKIALYSFYKYNKNFTGEIIVFYDEDSLANILDNIIVKFKLKIYLKKLNKYLYKDLKFEGALRTWKFNPAYRYEIFQLSNFNKVLYLDCDILIADNILDIFYKKCNFGACRLNKKIEREYSESSGFNGGVLLIGKRYLNNRTISSLIEISKRYSNLTGNQIVLNKFFHKKVKYLDQNYNVTTDLVNDDLYKNGKIFHFIGENKPWNSCFNNSFHRYILSNSGEYMLLKLYIKYKAMQNEANIFYRT